MNRDNVARQAPAPGRGGGTGRREAVSATLGDAMKTTQVTADAHVTLQTSNPTSDTRTYTGTSITASREYVAPHATVSKVSRPFFALCIIKTMKTLFHMSCVSSVHWHLITVLRPLCDHLKQSEGALTGGTAVKVTPPAHQLSTQPGEVLQPKYTIQPQLKFPSTHAKPWTPARPAVPLTAALTALSYSLSDLEFSADGDETEPGSEGPEVPQMVPVLTFTTPGKTVYSFPLQRATSSQPGARSGTTSDKHMTTCADRPCFPGVQCEALMDGGFHCGRCPVGYTGDGRACRGMNLCL